MGLNGVRVPQSLGFFYNVLLTFFFFILSFCILAFHCLYLTDLRFLIAPFSIFGCLSQSDLPVV
jgi:hypothetical protein